MTVLTPTDREGVAVNDTSLTSPPTTSAPPPWPLHLFISLSLTISSLRSELPADEENNSDSAFHNSNSTIPGGGLYLIIDLIFATSVLKYL